MKGESREEKNRLMLEAGNRIRKARDRQTLMELAELLKEKDQQRVQIPVPSDGCDDESMAPAISKRSEIVDVVQAIKMDQIKIQTSPVRFGEPVNNQ